MYVTPPQHIPHTHHSKFTIQDDIDIGAVLQLFERLCYVKEPSIKTNKQHRATYTYSYKCEVILYYKKCCESKIANPTQDTATHFSINPCLVTKVCC